ncbi:MAG: hypothetical protein ACI32O_09010 [Enterococcus sp.]
MKKQLILLLGTIALFGACQKQDKLIEESTTSSSSVSSADATKSDQETTNQESSSYSNTPATKNLTALQQLQQDYPNIPMPNDIPVTTGSLNIAATQIKQGFSVQYYQGEKALPLNDPSLNQETPIASYLYRDGFASSQETINTIQPFTIDTGGRKIDLGHSIVGFQQGAAGSSYLEWQEGNWRFRLRVSNIEGQDPVPQAKEIVNYLESALLPAPEQVGVVMIDSTDASNQHTQVSWQEPTTVYTITNQEPLNALKMAVSMTQ